LRQHLKEHLGFLDESGRLYDHGKEHEAKRLATSIRVLIHDTRKSHSLLHQLGVKSKITYWSVLLQEADLSCRSYMGIGISIGFGAVDRYVPILIPPQRQVPFDKWWDDDPLIVEGTERLTRRRAVLALANKDGGAHVDPTLSDLDRRLLRTDLMGWQAMTVTASHPTTVKEESLNVDGQKMVMRVTHLEGGQTTVESSDLKSPTGAAVRQIAHELCGTIREHLGHLLV
jgi:hypothetical protein